MADIDVRRVHNLGIEEARRAAEKLAAELGKKFDLKGDWRGDVLHFQRPGVSGTLGIDAKALHLSVSLGFLLKAMKGSIERAVVEKLDAVLPARAAAAAPKPKAAVKPKKAPARPKKAG